METGSSGISIRSSRHHSGRSLEELLHPLPVEKNVTPTAMCYEMIRAAGDDLMTGSNFSETDYIYTDWAFVDGHVLLHFLLYLNHNKLNMESHATTDIASMERLIASHPISHRETCYNLLV